MQGWERAMYALLVQRSQPSNTNLYSKKEEKGKTVKDKTGERLRPIKALTLLVKPASPTP